MSDREKPDFAPFADKMRQEGLSEVVIDNFHYYYDILASGSVGMIPESSIQSVETAPDVAETKLFIEAGRAALGRAVMLKLNGGLGTSMGLDRAKSLLIARDNLTFLDIIARQALSFAQRFDERVPLVLLNSFNTDADSREVLAHYPELEGPIPLTLMQNKVPKVLQDELTPAQWPEDAQLEWCPPGHGEVYVALAISGMLDTLLSDGYEYMFLSNVDNLGATLDLGILGYIATRNVPFLMEVADRTEADKKGGHIARQHDGQLLLREIAQCPDEDLSAFQDIGKHKYFNTNNIWINLRRLKEMLVANNNIIKLPMIRNAKTVDPKDGNSPKVYQLETAMGAAIAIFPGAEVLRVTRARFMPVKTCEDLLRLRSDAYVLDESFQIHAADGAALTVIVLDSKYYKRIDDFEARFPAGAPSLRACKRLAVQGDVEFGARVVCEGVVRVINSADEQRRIEDDTTLADNEIDVGRTD